MIRDIILYSVSFLLGGFFGIMILSLAKISDDDDLLEEDKFENEDDS